MVQLSIIGDILRESTYLLKGSLLEILFNLEDKDQVAYFPQWEVHSIDSWIKNGSLSRKNEYNLYVWEMVSRIRRFSDGLVTWTLPATGELADQD